MLKLYSPTSILTYLKCPRLYYYRYIKGIRVEQNIHMYKGTVVHKTIEETFKNSHPETFKRDLLHMFKQEWHPEMAGISLTKKELTRHKKEAEKMLKIFADNFLQKLKLVALDNKIKDMQQAWYSLKPKLSEHRIVNNELKVQGIIDSIEKDFNGKTFIIDYKTSKKYKNTVTNDYLLQLKIYALLYEQENHKLPDFVGLNYLRYGETIMLPVSKEMVDEARTTIEFVKQKTKSTDIKDYPLEGDKWSVAECKAIEKTLK